MARVLPILLVVVIAGGCGGSPTRPTPTTTPPTRLFSGQITETLTGLPVPQASVAAEGLAPVQADAAGAFRFESTSMPTHIVVSAPGYVTRDARVSGTGAIGIDVIRDEAPFSLGFYRQMVRDGYDAPDALKPLRRWTRAPSVYLTTIDDAGAAIDVAQLDSAESALRGVAEMFTGGRFGLAALERGTGTREGQAGWITVKWLATNAGNFCATADVAREGGSINLNYTRGGGCRCGSLAIRPRTVKHETGHAFGFWHTDNTADLMSGIGVSGCDADPSARERHHAAISYSRPVGSLDVDVDPVGATVQSMRVID